MPAFGPLNNTPYDQRFIGQQLSFLPFHSNRVYHLLPHYPYGGYPMSPDNNLAQYGMNAASFIHPRDRQYQYQQRWNYWKQEPDSMTLSVYDGLFPIRYSSKTAYPLGMESQFINYPVVDSFDMRRSSPPQVVGYRPVNVVYTDYTTLKLVDINQVRRAARKKAALFVPSCPLPVHQPCIGPLGIPPFLFNCMSQPLCSLPLPPPLPHVASLCLENDVRQAIMERHVNPVAVFPVASNWQISPYHTNVHPSTYCAYIPEPTPLNNSIKNNTQITHRSPPHHRPASATKTKVQPNSNRIIPSPGFLNALPSRSNQTKQQHRDPYITTSVSQNYRSHRTPSLPPGGILIMDEYIDDYNVSQGKHHSRKNQKQTRRDIRPLGRSITINPRKTQPLSEITETDNTSVKPEKTITSSTDEKVNSSSNTNALRDIRLSLAMRDNQLDRSAAVPDNSIKEDEEKSDEKTNITTYPLSSLRSVPKTTQTDSFTERPSTGHSLSPFRRRSRSTMFSTKDSSIDSVSLASVFRPSKRSGRRLSSTDTFDTQI